MPQIRNYEDQRIKAIVGFRGIRKIPFLRWIPYITGQKPSINLTVRLLDKKYTVKLIAIDCDAPKQREDSLFYDNYGWYTTEIKIGEQYKITLPVLDRAGNYEYRVNVHMDYGVEGQKNTINSAGKIMSTGNVYWQENVGMSIVFLILGSGLTLLIQLLIRLLGN